MMAREGVFIQMAKTRQLKISVEPGIADAFKAACTASGLSMASELSLFMRGHAGIPATAKARDKTSTRGRRRKTVREAISLLQDVAEAEGAYLDAIPENLLGGSAHDAAQAAVEALEEAIYILEGAFE